ncbi:hypothetical protein T492DRAFT_1090489 [Pavlovales sp. CCMP2436]|nr:hypothetical protein T492DRAFT_1090489 [Pavlovales sp. CCMP2436]|mmetsp:Transcript_43915/g.108653  ORF Transcript_43915/g.108653 Transcript_43915/m.108653 type:complete len:155 (+) Transcript_43915:112-576(+)
MSGPVRNGGKTEEAQLYEVVVPPGLSSGDTFIADVNGVQMNVIVPPNVSGGDSVRVALPAQGRPISDEELARQMQAEEEQQAFGTHARGRRVRDGMGDVLLVQAPPGHILVEERYVSPAGIFCCVLTCPFLFPFNFLGLLFTEKRLVPVRVVNV